MNAGGVFFPECSVGSNHRTSESWGDPKKPLWPLWCCCCSTSAPNKISVPPGINIQLLHLNNTNKNLRHSLWSSQCCTLKPVLFVLVRKGYNWQGVPIQWAVRVARLLHCFYHTSRVLQLAEELTSLARCGSLIYCRATISICFTITDNYFICIKLYG